MSECYGGKLCPECNPEPKITDERLRQAIRDIDNCNVIIGTTWMDRDDDRAIAILRKLIEESKFVGLGIVNLDAANTSPYPHKVVANPSFGTTEESK